MVLIIIFNKQHLMSEYTNQVSCELQIVSRFLALSTVLNSLPLSSSIEKNPLDDYISQQSQTANRQSSPDKMYTEYMGFNSLKIQVKSYDQPQDEHIRKNTTLNQNKEFKKSSKSHNFPKFFAGDVIRILEEQKKAQQNIQFKQNKIYVKQYHEFFIKQLKKNKNIICLKNLLIFQEQSNKVQTQFIGFLKLKKVFTDSKTEISVLMRQACLSLIKNKKKFMKMAEKRQIKQKQKLLQYKQYVENILNDLKDFKMRCKARKNYITKAKMN